MRLSTIAGLGVLVATAAPPALAQNVEVLHSFDGTAFSSGPKSLLAGQDGLLYGTTFYGSASVEGTIFRMTPSGGVTILHSFAGGSDGSGPSALIQASDGRFYGTTSYGGAFARGTVFRVGTDGTLAILHSFGSPGSASNPRQILLAVDGRLYGTSSRYIDPSGSENYLGAIFRMNIDGSEATTLHAFASADGVGNGSVAALMQASDGTIVGTSAFGMNGHGGIFTMASDGTVTVIHAFAGGSLGDRPWGAVVEGADGTFYGTTRVGGAFDKGTVFRMTPAGAVTVLYDFSGNADGSEPVAALVQAADGHFYGTASSNLPYAGTGAVFKITPAGSFSLLHAFTGGLDGSNPDTGIVQLGNGLLFGGTSNGGIAGLGVAFSIDNAGAVVTVHAFNVPGPDARLTEGMDGKFYGATCGGGLYGNGEVFRVSHSGVFTSLYSFLGSPDGACPKGLVHATDGFFYGTAAIGGSYGGGTVYRLTADGTFTMLHAFGQAGEGSVPAGAPIQASDGHLYGTTRAGGSSNVGIVFRMTASGAFTLIHSFTGGMNGASPTTGLFQASDGMLYGLTGPVYGLAYGALFRMTLSGAVSIVHTFTFAEILPAALVEGGDHNFYGVGTRGIFWTPHNAAWCAELFRLTPDGAYARLSSEFARCNGWHEGEPYAVPLYTVTARRNGTLVGTEGTGQGGFVVEFDPAGPISTVQSLVASEGRNVVAPLLEGTDGNLYGVAKGGGAFSRGTAFRLRYTLHAPAALSVSAVGSGVKLAWAPVAGAIGYTIRRSSISGGETLLAATVAGTDYVDTTAVRGQRYYYIVTALNAFGEGDATYEVSITAGRSITGDFDGDGRADVAVFRPSTGVWYIRHSSTAEMAAITWGGGDDEPAPGDYDGDGISDVAIFRSTGVWYIRLSTTFEMIAIPWGASTDIPVPGDYDGDGRTDVAIFRPSTGVWHIRQTGTSTELSILWGLSTDTPVPGDYDGDGMTDVAVFRASTATWYARASSTFTMLTSQFGAATDTLVPEDYDGDGRTDIAVFRPTALAWHFVESGPGTSTTISWGGPPDVAVPGDYDGDGRADVAVFRRPMGVWYIRMSADGSVLSGPWGDSTDVPILERGDRTNHAPVEGRQTATSPAIGR